MMDGVGAVGGVNAGTDAAPVDDEAAQTEMFAEEVFGLTIFLDLVLDNINDNE
ncbi:MAG: hypothetical protein WBG95_05205 [Sulfitobacter sp.]